METFRRARVLLLLVLTTVVLAACSSGDPTGPASPIEIDDVTDPIAAVLAASDAALGSGSMHMTFELVAAAMGQEIEASGESDVSFGDEPQQHTTFRYDSFPGMPDDLEMELMTDGSMMYVRMPMLQDQGLPTEWVSIDLSASVPGYEDLVELGSGQNDPTDTLAFLQGAKDAEVVGSETVNGLETTHYRVTVDMAEAVTEVPEELRAEVKRSLAQYRQMFGSLIVPFDVWIDDDGLLRRMSYEMEGDGPEAGSFSMSMTMDVTEYGNDFALSLPAEEDVTDITALAGR
jgi:hypothetical protein